MRLGASLIVIAVALVTPVFAQSDHRVIVVENAPIMALPDTIHEPLRVVAKGTSLVLLEEQGEWLHVQFLDPTFRSGIGYLHTKYVQESVPAQLHPHRPQSGLPRRVFLAADISSLHPHAGGERYTLTKTMYGEPAVGTATYRTSPRTSIAIPLVNVALSRQLLVGARVARPKYDTSAGLSLQLPHPIFANRPGTGTHVTDLLQRKDVIVDLMATYLVDRGPWAVQVFGGPTYFATSQEMVRGMNYRHSLGTNAVTITEVLRETVTGAAWGANGGIDFSYYMWRHLGFGGGAHLNFGRIRVAEEPLTGEPTAVSMGSTTWNSGVRVRF
jgi:hypothetical protein